MIIFSAFQFPRLALTVTCVVALSLWGCAPKTEAIKTENQAKPQPVRDSIYTFDETPADTLPPATPTPAQPEITPTQNQTPQDDNEPRRTKGFTVQIGAFSTIDKADEFAALHRKKIPDKITVYYSEAIKLFVVQLLPLKDKQDAERRRNELWQLEEYKDAFVVEVTENQ